MLPVTSAVPVTSANLVLDSFDSDMALHARSVAAARVARTEESRRTVAFAGRSDASSHTELLRAASEGTGIGDDRIKDAHVAGWFYSLEPAERDRWVERFAWIRRVDRMAEAEALDTEVRSFRRFEAGWIHLRNGGGVCSSGSYAALLTAIQRCWFDARGRARDPFAVRGFDAYVAATGRYHPRGHELRTLAEFEQE
jgi:hypothetical protein